jgi:hypothetical protein
MTMIQKCWTGIREMNKYESTRGGMQSLELLMMLMASYQEIKQNIRGRENLEIRIKLVISR